jgi:Fic family protein
MTNTVVSDLRHADVGDSRARQNDPLFRRVIGEFEEMPGERLSLSQARRLFGLDLATCLQVLEELVRIGFLTRLQKDVYMRRDMRP